MDICIVAHTGLVCVFVIMFPAVRRSHVTCPIVVVVGSVWIYTELVRMLTEHSILSHGNNKQVLTFTW